MGLKGPVGLGSSGRTLCAALAILAGALLVPAAKGMNEGGGFAVAKQVGDLIDGGEGVAQQVLRLTVSDII